MKRFISVFLALVLMFALSITVLAEGEHASDASVIDGTGTTVVSLITNSTSQVSATVPLAVTLAIASDGTVTGPSNYTITNTSVMPIRVSDVTITPNTGFVTTDATGTKIGGITLTEGQGGTGVALNAWVHAKNATAWDMATGGAITLGFGGTVTDVTQDITTATVAFNIEFTIIAGSSVAG